MDQDALSVIHTIYRRGLLSMAEASGIPLRCNPDTFSELQMLQILTCDGSNWGINPGVNSFIKNAERTLSTFPPRDWIFQFLLNDPPAQPPECFIAMPYGPVWFPSVRDALMDAVKTTAYKPVVGDDIEATGAIVSQVWTAIRRADRIVADVTGRNPNVMYEIGMAHALGKPVVLVTQDSTNVPFDIQSERHIRYADTALPKLQTDVVKALSA